MSFLKYIFLTVFVFGTYHRALSSTEKEGKLINEETKSSQIEKKTHSKKNKSVKKDVAKESEGQGALKSVLEKYSKAKTIKMKVKKIVQLTLLEKKKEYKGELFIKKGGRLRLDLKKPEKSMIIINDEVIWSVSYPSDPEFDNTIRVLKLSASGDLKSQFLFLSLLGKSDLLKVFNVKSGTKSGHNIEYFLSPKKETDRIKELKINISLKKGIIKSLEYTDDLDNQIVFQFEKVYFGKRLKDKLFQFVPPKNAEVTIL